MPSLTGAGVIVVAIILYVAWISPHGRTLSNLNQQQQTLQAQQSQLQTELASLKADKAHQVANCAALAQALAEVPSVPTVDSFLQQVTALAVSSGDPNTPSISVTQAPGSTGSSGATPITVNLTLQGTYGQMTSFLHGLESFPRLFTVSNVAISGGPVVAGGGSINPSTGGYSLTLTGAIYYSPGHQTLC